MANPVSSSASGDVAIVTVDNPPVNALGPGVAEGILEAVLAAEADPALSAIVLIAAGRTFIAGADIKEFAKVVSGESQPSKLPEIARRIEDCSKPVVCAIHGNALGGGLELAQACHYRVAVAGARLGQPEVKLGIIPGAAGTQRLPRLVGVVQALAMCTSGDPISAQDALACGLVDRIVDGPLLDGAVAFAREAPGPRRTRDLPIEPWSAELFEAARANVEKRYRNLTAPLRAIDAIEAATSLSFDRGCAEERRIFGECLFSDQSKALIHVFFGEREAAKAPGIPAGVQAREIRQAAVAGAGTMGGGIAMALANAGIPVLLKEADQAALDRGLAAIRKNYAASVKKGRFQQETMDARMALIRPTLGYEDFAQADLVIEAVFEGMALKKQVFAELDRACRPDAILASNTSTLDIDEIASATTRPEQVLGLHFFSPAHVMRLLEVVRGKASSPEVLATGMALSRRLGKTGVLVGNGFGFVGNRMFGPYRREAQFLVEEGAAPREVDAALCEFGMAMGPLATGDLAGLDVGRRIRQETRHLEPPGLRQPLIEDRLCELGRFGQKTGAGWYRYNEHRVPHDDPAVAELIAGCARQAGIPRRSIPREEMADRCVLALVNEGARLLEEGIACRPVDIDIIYISGYGFPAFRGGPMWYADTLGLGRVLARIKEFEEKLGAWWKPAPLLERLAAERGKFGAK